MEDCHALHRKPLLLLTDAELSLALSQHIGLAWTRTLVLVRLGQDPLRGCAGHSFDALLRQALLLEPEEWGDLLPELQQVASIVPTLPETWENMDLSRAYERFRAQIPS